MRYYKLKQALLVLCGLDVAIGQDIITDDSFFYGESPPVYPSPESTGSGSWNSAHSKARKLVAQMTLDEKINLTTGYATTSNGCSGHIYGVPRLGFPGLCLNDGDNGLRGTDFASSWPSGIHVGASWNADLAAQRASAMGAEFKKKGVNVLLGPVAGPVGRVVEGGRYWEGFSIDPYLSGSLVARTVSAIQDAGTIACTKHFIGNEQETNRNPIGNISSVSSNVDDATLHETYLWAFQDALRAGSASIMCSYNRLNNSYSCQNSKLLNGILKTELGFQGAVISDWGALHGGYAAALAGLDMAMPDGGGFWSTNLTMSVQNGSIPESRVDDMATRILSAWYQTNQDKGFPQPGVGMPYDLTAPHERIEARNPASKGILFDGAVEGHVLVKNVNSTLPLKKPASLYLAGYSATIPSQNGPSSGSSLVSYEWSLGYESVVAALYALPAVYGGQESGINLPSTATNGTIISGGGSGSTSQSTFISPFAALVQRADNDNTQLFWDFESAEPSAPQSSDACLVFANAFATEIFDRPALTDDYTDGLILSVAASCSNTIVIIHNAGPRLVDQWIDHPNITAVIFAHLPGQESGKALVSLLYGDSQFSGKLPYTVARNESDYGSLLSPSLPSGEHAYFPQSNFTEGVNLDYLRFDNEGLDPRFEFGFGLSYTTFNYNNLEIQALNSMAISPYPQGSLEQGGAADLWDVVARVSAVLSNIGRTDGAEVAQLYVGSPGGPLRRLRGFSKPYIKAGQKAKVVFELTRRDLSSWDVTQQAWKLSYGPHQIFVGGSSRNLPLQGTLKLA